MLGKKGPRWTGKIQITPHRLFEPLKWVKPRKIFVNSLSDVWHKDVPFQYVSAMFGVMAATPEHTFQVLTKRHAEMLAWYEQTGGAEECAEAAASWLEHLLAGDQITTGIYNRYLARLARGADRAWPLDNVWLGVSAENQEMYEARVPYLTQCPATVHWVSAEPLLGPLQVLSVSQTSEVDWIVVGGESGPRARGMELSWAKRILDDCDAVGIAVSMKQLGTVLAKNYPRSGKKGGNWDGWPKHLRIRQFPVLLD